MADYDVGKAFRRIENELISSMISNLQNHRAQETAEGIQWSQWQAKQLQALDAYKRQNKEKFSGKFAAINENISEAIQEAYNTGGMEQEMKILKAIKKGYTGSKRKFNGATNTEGEFFKVNERKLNALINSTTHDMQEAESAVLRMANDKYRKIIFDAQVYANAGGTTYEKAVDMATRDFLAAGLNCVEYKNGARHTISDYADMAVRTANKRAYLRGEGTKRAEWGIHTVIVNKRGNACPLCLPFVGMVLIDDVYSGGSSEDGDYTLLSSAMTRGFLHPRCEDNYTTYFEGISTPPKEQKLSRADIEDVEEKQKQEQQKQYAENQAKRMDRLAKYSLNEDNKKLYSARAERWKDRAENLGNPVANSAESGIIEETKTLSLNNIEDFEKWQNDYYKLNSNVSFERKDNPNIYEYTGGAYDAINAVERGGKQYEKAKKCYGNDLSEYKKISDSISKELSKFKLNTPLNLKRSVGDVDYITDATSSIEDMKNMIGKTFVEKGFTSTTLCADAQLSFGGFKDTKTTLDIIAPKYTKGAYVYKMSDSPAEFEFLIDKNTKFKILDAGEREIVVKDYKGNDVKRIERFMKLKVVGQ